MNELLTYLYNLSVLYTIFFLEALPLRKEKTLSIDNLAVLESKHSTIIIFFESYG